MKVTVLFGKSGVVIPCGDGRLTVGELIHQATQRFIKNSEKDSSYCMKVHHLEYVDGGILDPDDVLADVVDDKDKLIAVYDEQQSHHGADITNGSLTERHSPDMFETEVAAQLAAFEPISGEIEVTPSTLKSGTPLLVRRSSDPALAPPAEFFSGVSHPDSQSLKPVTVAGNQPQTEDSEADLSRTSEVQSVPKFQIMQSTLMKKVEISGADGPLGIHVVPFLSSLSGRTLGLFIRGIEENSRSKKEGLFQENESIVKINDIDLTDKSFAHAQDIFRQAMKSPTVLLEVVPAHNREQYEKSAIGHLSAMDYENDVPKVKVPPPVRPKPAVKTAELVVIQNPEAGAQTSLQQTNSTTQPKTSDQTPVLGKTSSPSLLGGFGSKKHGKKVKIDLKKGSEGLGFTVVTRDSSMHGPGPILVKNILPRGAAVKDGRLQSGDRILEVNGRDITGKTQEELVAMLRSTKQGETVSLIVARQDEMFIPRELKGEPDYTFPLQEIKEQLTFEIPLNDSGSAGLGVSLKGNKSRETGADLGIFIKSVIHGGAAYKDGRLRVNDQLIAVNGESLLGKSNHEAMETLRRSMSMEGNIRGMIQLVVIRRFERQVEDPSELVVIQKSSTNGSPAPQNTIRPNGTLQPPMVDNSIYDRIIVPENTTNWEDEVESPPPLPPHPDEEKFIGLDFPRENAQSSAALDSAACLTDRKLDIKPSSPARQTELINLKTSKSMDLVADESNVRSLAGPKSDSSSKDIGPTLGLKMSSSLESLQTAVAAIRKNELPFHRPRPHMVRGRGCNESFRAAIDKSYDGPEELEEDGHSDESSHSGWETPGSESAPQGNPESEDNDGKSKKNKKKKEKGEKKEKVKPKSKEKKKKEEGDDQEKKVKKKGFGAMLRFGKKKDDKSGKSEQKANSKQKAEVLSEEDLEKMKEERERIDAKHQELRDKQARDNFGPQSSPGPYLPDIEDDDLDPSYARVNNFRKMPPPDRAYRSPSPPQAVTASYQGELVPDEDPLEGLYAKVNKQRKPHPDSGRPAGGNADRIQQLRKEFHQARREGGAPLYEEHEARRRPIEYEHSSVPGKGPNVSVSNPWFDEMERQYASLPRRGPAEQEDYPVQPPVVYGERDPPCYPGVPPIGYTPRRSPDPRAPNYREPAFYPPPQHRGPLRQDIPPSPSQTQRAPHYDTMGRIAYRRESPDQYQNPYHDDRHQDPRRKNPMTAAV
ncbi:partitioning defective 3 homolog B isoform X2 [Latimeria chalumnae]|nr:PREDICTED: partitioning defective 3 homolog B isoform X2 [Latimeria chalumnae]|eukprot:XP_005998451.1 PREDICTED: partitioning defective 3 homolog B isoform X2 [Latimeria chalumnae]